MRLNIEVSLIIYFRILPSRTSALVVVVDSIHFSGGHSNSSCCSGHCWEIIIKSQGDSGYPSADDGELGECVNTEWSKRRCLHTKLKSAIKPIFILQCYTTNPSPSC